MKYFSKCFRKSLLSLKPNIIILFALSLLSSFMYFFVQISIDGNMALLKNKTALSNSDNALLVSLQSNQILAFSFLIILSLISEFVYFMFYKKYCSLHKSEWGCFLANGYSVNKMIGIVLTISVAFITTAYICGLCLGWIGSDIMMNLYREVYASGYLKKGLTIQNGLMALVCTVLPTMSAIPIIIKMTNNDTAILLNDSSDKGILQMGRISRTLAEKTKFSLRLALRKPFQLFMSTTAVAVFTILLIMSFSLNMSSQYVVDTMSIGRNYEYDISFPTLHAEQEDKKDCTYYLSEPIKIDFNKKEISGTIMGIETDSRLFTLTNLQKEPITDIPENTIVISQAMANLYGIQPKNSISIVLNGETFPMKVSSISENADNFTVYTSKNFLALLLNVPNATFNGIYANELPTAYNMKTAHIQSKEDRMAQLENNNVSNRISAVICQVLAGIIGCLLLYLTILLKFQEDTKSIFILDMLGYTTKQINKMLISVYRPILNIAFILLLIPSMEICKIIHKNLSLATNDYIPFQSNVMIIIMVFASLNLLYSVIKFTFNFKIRIIQKNENSAKYIA